MLALAACGGTGSSDPAAATSVLKIVNEADIGTFDPALNGNTEGHRLDYLTYGYLTKFPDGTPELAQALKPTDGNKSWTVTLRPGLKFSDGSPLTSKDVVASFERLLKPPTNTGEVVENIASVTAPDPNTVLFKLRQPDVAFAKSLAINSAAIFPAANVSSGSFFKTPPISAGPYVIDKGDLASGSYTLTQNPNYWGKAASVKEIDFTTVNDGGTRLAQLESGQVNYAKSIPASQLKGLPSNLHINKVAFPGSMIQLLLNDGPGSSSVTTDPKIRQAINLAVDREQIAKVALSGYMAPLYGIPWADPSKQADAFSRDTTKAKQLLQGTACANGCTIKLLNIADFNWQLPPVSQVVQQNLKDIGINVELVNQPSATIGKVTPSDDWDGMVGDTGSALMTDSSVARLSLTSFQWWTEPANDLPMFPELASLEAKLASAPAKKAAAVRGQIDTEFAKELPWIPLTNLYFLDVSSVPASVVESPIGWRLNLK